MATAGSIVIDLLMRTGAFETDTKRAEKRLREMQKTAKAVGTVIGTAFVAAGAALTVITGQAINAADEMRDLSIRLGTSTETLSAFGYAASQTGTDIETLGKGLKILAKNAADGLNPTSEYAKVFDALGIKVTDASGVLKDMSDLVPEIADKFAMLEDGTTKAALAQSLFGRAGLDMTEFLNQGAAGLGDMADKARELGIIIDSETATAADDFNDKLGDLRALVAGLGLTVAKELLPQLNQLVAALTEMVKGGSAASEIADTLSAGFKVMSGSIVVVTSTVRGITFDLIALTNVAIAAGKALRFDFAGAAKSMRNARDARELAAGESDDIARVFGGGPAQVGGQFANVRSSSDSVSANGVDAAALALALSNPTIPSGGKGRAKQLSDEEKEAQRLLETYQQLTAGFDERIALFGKEGEAAQIRYDIEHGELAKLLPAQQADLLAKAERLDLMQEEAELARKLADEDKRRFENFADVMGAIREQTELVGMSADQQEIWNNLKWAGVSADSEWRKQIIESTKALQQQRDAMDDQIEAMDAIRDAGKGLFRDIIDDPKNWKNAVFDALDSVQDRILDMIAENWMDQLFGKQGDPAGGSSGGWISSLIGSFFGGAKAGGGDAIANRAYLVGEQGPELFVPRTAGTVIPAGQSASIMSGSGRNVSVYQNFTAQGRIDPNTALQMAQDAAVKLRIATARA